MKQQHSLVFSLLVAALSFGGVVGCGNEGASSIPMPKKIVDLSPVINEDLIARQFGHRASKFLGLLRTALPSSPWCRRKRHTRSD